MSSKARISKFLGPKGKKQIAQAFVAVSKPKPTVKSLDRRIKKLNYDQELKWIDTFYNGSTITPAGAIAVLNPIVKGDDVDERDANQINPTSIQWRLQFSLDTDQPLAPNIVRHLVLWDSQPQGALPTIDQILDTSVITIAVHAPYNRNYQKRFKILHDKMYVLNPQLENTVAAGVTTKVAQYTVLTKGKRQVNRITKYANTNLGTVADILSNGIISCIISNVGGEYPTLAGGYRVYFKDD